MLFSSNIFLYLFLPITLLFDLVILKKWRTCQNIFLLIASLFFYAWGEPKFVFIMIGSITVNWFFGLLIDKNQEKQALKKLLLSIAIFFNIIILFIFKYLNFSGTVLTHILGLNFDFPAIALPIGISFFTFQAMSYVIDIYKKKGEVQTNILYVGLYISFFPQLIAGPIVRYETIADQIKNRKENLDDLFDGFARFVIGLSKKVLLANSLAVIADQAFSADVSNLSVMFGWLGAIAYTLQIYFDFSGYSDMAIGLGRMFGFHFLENFDYPYVSKSITEFWRRWHISLSTWFRDYVYIPLGGSHHGKTKTFRNLFIVWLLTGIWHGANFTFIVWGLMYFALLVFEKSTGLNKIKGTIIENITRLYTLLFVIIGWVIFRADSLSNAYIYIRSMFGLNKNAISDGLFLGWFEQNWIILLLSIVFSTPLFKTLYNKYKDNIFVSWINVLFTIFLFVLSTATLTSSTYNPFIYFNF